MSLSSRLSKIVIVDNLPSPHHSERARVYPTPPNSPPRTKPDPPEVPRENENERRSSKPTTPSRPKTPPLERRLPEHKASLDASTLNDLLGLSNERCGTLTKAGTPCKREIPKRYRSQVNSLIASMSLLVQSSPALDIKLESLAKLVLCRDHNHDEKKDSRIDEWRQIFPDGEVSTEPRLVLIEARMRKVLGSIRVQCIAILRSGKPCEESIGGQKVENCRRSIAEILKLEVYSNDKYLEGYLRVLETNMYCADHMVSRKLERTELWKSQIKAIAKSYNRKPPTAEKSRFVAPDFSLGFANFWPKAFDVSPFVLITKQNSYTGSSIPQTSYRKVQEKLISLLTKKDEEDGYVYLFEVEGNKGLVKIGYTVRTIIERQGEWRFDCNRDPKNLYPMPYTSAIKVPHARRVEGLCHAELDYCRRRFYCRSCLKEHIEWFETSPEKAISVIQRWSNWIRTHPYQPRELKDVVKWSLKEEERRKIIRIAKFMTDTAVVTAPGSKQTPSS